MVDLCCTQCGRVIARINAYVYETIPPGRCYCQECYDKAKEMVKAC